MTRDVSAVLGVLYQRSSLSHKTLAGTSVSFSGFFRIFAHEISFKNKAIMIKMYVMHTCPDCEYVEKQVMNNPNFEVIDIGKHVRNLKQFIKLRETNPAFDEAKAVDDLGIPCYVLEDGTVTLYSKDVGLEPRPQEEGPACSIDGRGC